MNYIWLSYVLDTDTPAYGGGSEFASIKLRDMEKGDSCNKAQLTITNHIGTHVDAPRHFVKDGKCIDDYKPEEWIFKKPLLVDLKLQPGQVITVSMVEQAIDKNVVDADLVMIRTGFEQHRTEKVYWENSPAYSPDLCNYFKQRYPSFSVIGMDTISISSLAHRDLGREAHRAFLGQGVRIVEDMKLGMISNIKLVSKIFVMPIRQVHSDGAPVTAFAELND
jgi:kynurenine formamidase